MDATLSEWINLIVRWIHIVAGITWIGQSYFFHWLDSHLLPSGGSRENVVGEAWMVHSGGFYFVEKQKFTPGVMPKTLYWFKWEAALSWITGVSLLGIVYYLGGALVRPDSQVSVGMGTAIGIGTLALAWIAYDIIWRSPLARVETATIALCFALVIAAAYFLTQVLSGRAAYIHVGAMFGTIMAANVWMRIIPAQRRMVLDTQNGKTPDYGLGDQAKLRSKHNSYMSVPLIFIMVSSHFPTASYGHEHNWIMLGVFVLAGWGARKALNLLGRAEASAHR